jgi:hypothetical protein
LKEMEEKEHKTDKEYKGYGEIEQHTWAPLVSYRSTTGIGLPSRSQCSRSL